jgi:hypothetical protein
MATRTSFTERLICAYTNKLGEFRVAEAKRIETENEAKIKAYQETPAFIAFYEAAKKLMGAKWVAENLVIVERRLHWEGELRNIIGLTQVPEQDREKTLTLLTGALATTKIKFWDGLFPPVNAYLDAIEKATNLAEADGAAMTLVEALA